MAELTPSELFDPATVARLLEPPAEAGVLSIYVDADSRSDPGLRGAAIDLRNRLAELERNVESEGPRERARALNDALERLGPEIERLTSPKETGRGRALFAPIVHGEATRVASQLPLRNRVVLDASAFIHPLLELLDEGQPVGVVLASHDEAQLLEWRLGELERLERLEPDVVQAPHERSGPVGSSPAARAYSPEREQREARADTLARRFLDRVGRAAVELAGKRRWERVLVSGGEQLTEPLASALAAGPQHKLIRDSRVLVGLEPATLGETVTERVRAEHADSEQRLVAAVRETAVAGRPAALGLSDVVGALNEGRVAHLLYDPGVRYRGSVAADGTLRAGHERAGETPATAEPRLTERLVERALSTGARVTPVEDAAAGALSEAEGIAALLRW